MHQEAEQHRATKPQDNSAWKAAAPDGELIFVNVARLKKAMKAARTVLRTHEPSSRADAACRVISRKGKHTAEVLATDGHRLCMIEVTPIRESAGDEEFDVAMPLEAVRAIANARRTAMVRIGRIDEACVVAFGREDTAGTTYARCNAFSVRTFDRIIEQEAVYAAVAEMPRIEALSTLQRTTPTDNEYNPKGICRFEIAEDGLRVWPTTCEPTPEETGNGRKIADKVARFDKRIVFGMRHRHMVETLRTMTAATIWMVIDDGRKPIHMGATSGDERYVISAFALSGPQQNNNGKYEGAPQTKDDATRSTPSTPEAEEDSKWSAAARDGALAFDDVAKLQRAMTAARRILQTDDRNNNAEPACQLVATAKARHAQLFAADGKRMCEIRLALGEPAPEEDFELAISLATVRTIATCTAPRRILIGKDGQSAVLQIKYATERTTRRQAPAKTWIGSTFRRWHKTETAGAMSADIEPGAALKEVGQWRPRPGEVNEDRACRLQMTPNELRVWQTRRAVADANDGAGAVLSTQVVGCKRSVTIGIDHQMLVDTLRSIGGTEAVMTVQGPDRSVHVQSKDGTEYYVLMPYRLSE